MLSDHLKTVTKYPCNILTVDVSSKTVQGIMRSGPVHIAVYTTDPFFRWPIVGEQWLIRQENGTWYLDGILQNPGDETLLTELNPGDAHINVVGKVHLSEGTTLARKYTQIVGNGSGKEWTISHSLNDLAVNVSVIATTPPNAPITAFSWAPVVLESGAGDPNNLKVNFTSAPAIDGALVIVTG